MRSDLLPARKRGINRTGTLWTLELGLVSLKAMLKRPGDGEMAQGLRAPQFLQRTLVCLPAPTW